MKSVKEKKPFKKSVGDTDSFEKLSDLIGKIVVLTFKHKSINQYKRYEIIGLSEGFLRLKGIEQDVRKPRSSPWYQSVSAIDTINVTDER